MIIKNDLVILRPLTEKDAEFFYHLYANPLLIDNFDESPFLKDETPPQFTSRIVSKCNLIFIIHPASNPDIMIGDCALHGWDRLKQKIEVGGALLPDHWGKGYMQAAFELLIDIAKKEFGVKTVLGQTKHQNHRAIRLVEKMGFVKHSVSEDEIVLSKRLD